MTHTPPSSPPQPPNQPNPNTVQIHSSARSRVGRTSVRRDVRELLTVDPPPPTVTEPPNDESCAVCGDGDGPLPDDVVANYWDGSRPALAHVDCAPSTWRLA